MSTTEAPAPAARRGAVAGVGPTVKVAAIVVALAAGFAAGWTACIAAAFLASKGDLGVAR